MNDEFNTDEFENEITESETEIKQDIPEEAAETPAEPAQPTQQAGSEAEQPGTESGTPSGTNPQSSGFYWQNGVYRSGAYNDPTAPRYNPQQTGWQQNPQQQRYPGQNGYGNPQGYYRPQVNYDLRNQAPQGGYNPYGYNGAQGYANRTGYNGQPAYNAQQGQNNGYGYNQNGYGNQPAQPQYTPQKTQDQPKTKAKGNGKLAVLAVIMAVAIILVGVGAFTIGRSVKEDKPKDTSSSVTDVPSTEPSGSQHTAKPETTNDVDAITAVDEKADPAVVIDTSSSNGDYVTAASKAVDSVVEIRTEAVTSGVFMQQYISKGAGSGVIITADGYIATNNHVIDGATNITVILRDGTQYPATLVGKDSLADIAVVKVDATDLKPATFASSDNLIVAQAVIAIGNPLGELGGSVTQGIISALARTVKIEGQEMTLMQTTAAVNPGNSGGGLFNLKGECVGIVNAKSYGTDIEGIGFAIPSDTALSVINDIMKYGYARGRVAFGVTMVEITDAYTAYRYGVSELGVYINNVTEGSDAEAAGLKSGDRIVSFNGNEIQTFQQFKNLLQKCKVGDVVDIVISRKGAKETVQVTLSEYKPE